jgi:hypothetical protein
MGVDVELHVRGLKLTDEELKKRELMFVQLAPGFGHPYNVRSGHIMKYWEFEEYDAAIPEPYINIYTLERYYYPGGDRGNWPRIYAGIMAALEVFPDGRVYYGNDSGGPLELVTDKLLEMNWRAWKETR